MATLKLTRALMSVLIRLVKLGQLSILGKKDSKMFVIVESGGFYDECYLESNLFAVEDQEVATMLVEAMQKTYEAGLKVREENQDLYSRWMRDYVNENPQPTLASFQDCKPTHPQMPQQLTGLTASQMREHPLGDYWYQQIALYDKALQSWKDKQCSVRQSFEQAASHWRERLEAARAQFLLLPWKQSENFVPLEWQKKLSHVNPNNWEGPTDPSVIYYDSGLRFSAQHVELIQLDNEG